MRIRKIYFYRKELLLSLLFLGLFQLQFAQIRNILSGYIFSADTKQALEGASVIDIGSGNGSVSDSFGFYSIEPKGKKLHLRVSYIGFEAIDTTLEVGTTMHLNFYLKPDVIKYEEVKIIGRTGDDFVNSIRMGEVNLSRDEINSLPKLLGEADPIRFLQLTPGVQSSSEGGIGFFVRGGGVDQNLVLYNNAPIYNPGHLLGFISVFNPDIISDVSLIKSGIPARFGGRLSSVVRVNPDLGRSDSLRIKGQIGMVASRITVNRSFFKERGSFILSARRASIDLFVKPIIFPLLDDANPFLKESSYNFFDLSGSISYKFGKKDYLNISAFYGNDDYGIERSSRIAETRMNWGNFIVSANWKHVYSDKLILGTTISKTDYHFDLSGAQSEYVFSLLSSVNDYTVKSLVDYFGNRHKISFGYEISRHVFTPNDIDVDAHGLTINFLSYNQLFAYEGGIFAEDEFRLSDKFGVSFGLRYSFFNQVGPYKEYVYDQTALLKDSILYPSGQSLALYHHPEPRISAKYQLSETSSIKASYMHMAQYIHLATSATVSLPTDIWLPSSRDIRPQYGDQLCAGYFVNWMNDQMESSIEVYYKHSRNQIEFLRGVISSSINQTLTDNLTVGIGRSYGAEFFLRKKKGILTGWAGYTISRSVREFELINDGRIYPAKFDRRHDLSLAGVCKLNKNWNFSLIFIYVSGNAFTLPIGRYIIQGNLINQYGRVNNYRMPAYNRLDLSASRSTVTRRGNKFVFDFSVYNAYNRANPFYIYFETTGDLEQYKLEVEPVIVSLFPIVPTVSWRFEF